MTPKTVSHTRKRQITMRDRITSEIDRLKEIGRPFCPADVGKAVGTDAKTVACNIREREDVYQISRCTGDKCGYKSSVWGFREVEA